MSRAGLWMSHSGPAQHPRWWWAAGCLRTKGCPAQMSRDHDAAAAAAAAGVAASAAAQASTTVKTVVKSGSAAEAAGEAAAAPEAACGSDHRGTFFDFFRAH